MCATVYSSSLLVSSLFFFFCRFLVICCWIIKLKYFSEFDSGIYFSLYIIDILTSYSPDICVIMVKLYLKYCTLVLKIYNDDLVFTAWNNYQIYTSAPFPCYIILYMAFLGIWNIFGWNVNTHKRLHAQKVARTKGCTLEALSCTFCACKFCRYVGTILINRKKLSHF